MTKAAKLIFGAALILWAQTGNAAVDSYRYLHVTVETPWTIFMVLLPMVLAPLILMGVLVWRFAEKKEEKKEGAESISTGGEEK